MISGTSSQINLSNCNLFVFDISISFFSNGTESMIKISGLKSKFANFFISFDNLAFSALISTLLIVFDRWIFHPFEHLLTLSLDSLQNIF